MDMIISTKLVCVLFGPAIPTSSFFMLVLDIDYPVEFCIPIYAGCSAKLKVDRILTSYTMPTRAVWDLL